MFPQIRGILKKSAEDMCIGELGLERGQETEGTVGACFEPETEGKRPGYAPNPQRDCETKGETYEQG